MVEHTEFWGAPVRNERPRPLESAQCSLCGIELPKGLMMPDGGRACTDIRWYCKDSRSCTDRWTARLARGPRLRPEPVPRPDPVPGLALEGAPAGVVEGSEESV